MKVQYFGDKHDFRKYALLRKLAGEGDFRIGICWMLTEDDARTDGGMRAYLDEGKPRAWRIIDGDLYELLMPVSRKTLADKGLRSPTYEHFTSIERNGLIKGAVYFNDYLTHSAHHEVINDKHLQGTVNDTRIRRYFQKVVDLFSDGGSNGNTSPDLIFIDPDNGLDVPSCPITYQKSYKYLYLQEAQKLFSGGKSLLIYQHFPFIKKDVFVPHAVKRLSDFLGGCIVKAFETPNVLFLAAVQPKHELRLQKVLDFVAREWPRKEKLVWVSEHPSN
jgi:hypothetical protein